VSHFTENATSQAVAAPLISSRLSMMLIVFPDQRDWYKANWAFRQLAQDIAQYCSPTPQVSDLLERSQLYWNLTS
jgi:hypothetical protein